MTKITNALPVGFVLRGKAYTYKIEKVLGQGSFGITYLASTTVQMQGPLGTISTTMKVAVKEFFMKDVNGRESSTVTSGSKGDGIFEKYRRKFVNEAKNLASLNHPNIIKVLEEFEANNTVYYAMEYIDGGSLDDLIQRRGALSEDEALRYTRQIASALSYMHSHKMLHLDLKPGNIMLKGNDVVLIDFGLSKHYDENGEPESSTTIGGGTPGYAPIEQSNYHEGHGFPVTMDIYALGGTMFKMLTGHRPPDASEILNDGFPYGELKQRGVSDHVVNIVAKAMAPMKKDRFKTVDEFTSALANDDNPSVHVVEPEDDSTTLDHVEPEPQVSYEPKEPVNTWEDEPHSQEANSQSSDDDYDDDEPSEPFLNNRKRQIKIVVGVVALIVAISLVFVLQHGNRSEAANYKHYTDISDIEIGDYLYSDGTFTHELDSTELQNCSGCVYNLTTTDYEHEQGWTHGHIVALFDATGRSGQKVFSWGEEVLNTAIGNAHEFNEAMEDKSGYYNTLMDSTCSVPAMSAIEDLDGKLFNVPLPEGSSWYLPALGEWVDILTNLGGAEYNRDTGSLTYNIEEHHTALYDKARLFGPDGAKSYWSSTQGGKSYAWSVSNDSFILSLRKDKMAVRPVAAF